MTSYRVELPPKRQANERKLAASKADMDRQVGSMFTEVECPGCGGRAISQEPCSVTRKDEETGELMTWLETIVICRAGKDGCKEPIPRRRFGKRPKRFKIKLTKPKGVSTQLTPSTSTPNQPDSNQPKPTKETEKPMPAKVDPEVKSWGDQLKKTLKEHGISQADICRKINKPKPTVSGALAGRPSSPETREEIGRAAFDLIKKAKVETAKEAFGQPKSTASVSRNMPETENLDIRDAKVPTPAEAEQLAEQLLNEDEQPFNEEKSKPDFVISQITVRELDFWDYGRELEELTRTITDKFGAAAFDQLLGFCRVKASK